MNPEITAFCEYPKTPRLFRDIIVTEKIDGTNAQVVVIDLSVMPPSMLDFSNVPILASLSGPNGMMHAIAAGSRNRWLTPQSDNFGFAKWVVENAEQLMRLGPGRHFGEWWGSGIQRGYDQPPGVRHFSLFNVSRWDQDIWESDEQLRYQRELAQVARKLKLPDTESVPAEHAPATRRFVAPPACCQVVPVLYHGPFHMEAIKDQLYELKIYGSSAAEGFMRPEGVVVFHTGANQVFKAFCNPED